MADEKYIMLFDGHCPTCNWAVNYVIEHDKKDKSMKFTSLQGEYAEQIRNQHPYLQNIDSVIIVGVNSQKVWIKSDAVLIVMGYLGGAYSLFKIFYLIPRFIRNFLYDLFAKNRYKFTGKYEVCMLPDKATKERTID